MIKELSRLSRRLKVLELTIYRESKILYVLEFVLNKIRNIMRRLNWEAVKEFYMKEFGIDEWLLELFANQDVLTLCASGASNLSISNITEIPIDEVNEIILKSFDFEGWNSDLPINPYWYYSNLMNELGEVKMKDFIEDLKTSINPDIDFTIAYKLCKAMWEIESRINNEWV